MTSRRRARFTGFQPALDACPDKAKHTPCPDGYIERSEWADKMMKTHKAIRCTGCGLYAVWVPNTPTRDPNA